MSWRNQICLCSFAVQVISPHNHSRASWKKQVSKAKALTTADVRDRVPSDATLICPVDNKLFRDAVKTPCCGTSYCEECIQTHLLERDFICPNCSKKIASLDGLEVDTPMRAKVNDYIEGEIEKSRTEGADEEMGMIRPMTDGPSVVCRLYQKIKSY